jgi:ABC-type multidrug transport system ATPase subunit
VLISSHVLAEAAQTVDEAVIIHRGKLIRRAAMSDVEGWRPGPRSCEAPRRTIGIAACGIGVECALEDGGWR